MLKFIFALLISIFASQTGKSQTSSANSISHIRLSFEIGENYLNIDKLNQELQDLDLLPLSPNTGNFAFQLGLGYNKQVEGYFGLALLFSSAYDDTMSLQGLGFSSSLNGVYVGAGVRINPLNLFNNRLILSIPLEINKAFYNVELIEAYSQNVPAHVLVDNSRVLLARYENIVAQPAVELFYRLFNENTSFDIGLKVGYLYHLFANDWSSRRGIQISGLSSIQNEGNFNFSLKLACTFQP